MSCLNHAWALGVLLLVGACPHAAKPEAFSSPHSSAPVEAVVTDARVGQEAPVSDAPPQPACEAGAECTARGERAFDEKRYLEAHHLFERACSLDDALGCKWLALELDDANDPRILVDPARVAPVMQKACDLGELQACWMLGNGYLYGHRSGVETPDPERAVKLYQKGCDGGEAGSCASLADCYEGGEGVAKSKALAKRYRKRAAELGYVGE